LSAEVPISATAASLVSRTRQSVADVLAGRDDRLVVVVGPCSIHDTDAALEYGERLKVLADRHADHLVVIMRTYFEKPRTSLGWKGFINDPDLDQTFQIDQGLARARRLLLRLNEAGVPTATEFLETQVPQHIGDLVSWASIGARTTESPIHRQLASGLSMPVGFKNTTDGATEAAIHGVLVARVPQWFPSVTDRGVSAVFRTTGNAETHIVLRGGRETGPNYSAPQVAQVCGQLAAAGLPEAVMIDCSHGNSRKDYRRQADVAADVGEQVASGSRQVFGVMLESHLVEGCQAFAPGRRLAYGQSITDACLSLAQTQPVLEALAAARRQRASAHRAAVAGV
jgi:3-deoxy-7-phosphoheptulonate synthase